MVLSPQVNSFIADTWEGLRSKTLGSVSSKSTDLLQDYEDIAEQDNQNNNNEQRNYSTDRHITEDFSKQFPARSVRHLNNSIQVILNILDPFYKQIESVTKSLDKSKPWRFTENQNVEVVDGYKSGYFEKLKKYSQITTLYLTSKLSQIEDYLVTQFYDYTSNNCDLIEKKSVYGLGKGKELYNTTCKSRPVDSLPAHPLQMASLRVSLPEGYNQNRSTTTLTFMHIVQNAFLKAHGDIFIDGRYPSLLYNCLTTLCSEKKY